MTAPFRWAILGTSGVARKFVLGLAATSGRAAAQSVASRDPENARRFARSLGVPRAAENWEDAVGADVDAVYIATPPTLHEAHARLAFAAGKPVLIEKPLAHDAATARRIAEAAEAAGVFTMEAMWTRFQPLVQRLRSEIGAGTLGELRGFHGTFLGPDIPDPARSVFDPDRGGGALLHRGIYPLSLAQFLLGPVARVSAAGQIGTTGVDEEAVLTLTHASGAVSSLRTGLRSAGANAATIWGTEGRIEIDAPLWRPERAWLLRYQPRAAAPAAPRRFEAFRESRAGQQIARARALVRGLRGGRGTALTAPYLGNGYPHEALELMDAVAAGRTGSEIMPLAESVETLEIIDAARAQIREAIP